MSIEASPDIVFEAKNLSKSYRLRAKSGEEVHALDGVNLSVRRGETLGIVGESGSGKTTLSRILLGVEAPSTGQVLFHGMDMQQLDRAGHHRLRHSVSAVFQSPFSSLDPRMRIWQIITEQRSIDRSGNRAENQKIAGELLQRVGLDPRVAQRYPHQLSGGQRQRVAIARALVSDPEVIILDEALSSLDVSVRAQIMNSLVDLQEELGLTYIFIAHDLAIVQHLCHRTIVMHRGRIVEEGPSEQIFHRTGHPYAVALIQASYLRDLGGNDVGISPSAAERPVSQNGCLYTDTCPIVANQCVAAVPELRDLGMGHRALCHFPQQLRSPGGS